MQCAIGLNSLTVPPKATDRKVMNTSLDNPEAPILALLSELQSELAQALDSLGGKLPKTITEPYFVEAAAYVNKAADGYLLLRKNERADASKLLVRPAIEALFRIQALRTKPKLLYQFAYTERLEDHKWFRPAAARLGKPYDRDPDPPGWDDFEKAFLKEFPTISLERKKISLRDVAEIAGLAEYYDTHYRLYCQYAHAALRGMSGHSDDISDPEDSRVMVLCAFAAVAAIAAIGAEAPKLEPLHRRVEELSKAPPLRLKRGPGRS